MAQHIAKKSSTAKSPVFFDKPIHLLLGVVVTIFVSEFFVMLVLEQIEPMPHFQEELIDSVLLSLLVFPALFFLFFRPLTSQITKRQQAEDEKDALIIDLKKALDEVKTLQGIIPICAYCNKIRDEEGLWSKLEAYIHSHSNAEFSHGVCPECYKKQMEE